MSAPVVGSARVEIEGDLSKFASQTETKIRDSVGKINTEVQHGFAKASDAAGPAGKQAGEAYTTNMASRTREGLTKTRSAMKQGLGTITTDATKEGGRAGQGLSTGMQSRTREGLGRLRSMFTGQLGDMAKGAAALFAVDKVKDFFGSAIDEARESQKVNAQTAQVIKSTGAAAGVSADQVGNLAGQISNYAGIDDEAIQAGQNMLLTFTGIHNAAGKNNDIFTQASKIMTDMSVATGTSMTGAALQLGKALNNPTQGVAALARVGVTFTAQQKAQIATMQKAGNVAGAQRLILGELRKEFGGSAAAQATAGQKMSVAFGNLKEQIGTGLIPVIDKVESIFTNYVIPAFSATVGWLTKHGQLIKTVLLVLTPFLAAWLAWTVATKVQAAATAIMTAAQEAFNLVMDANPIMLVVTALAALAAIFIIAWKKSQTFRDIVLGVWNAIKTAALWLWNNVLHPIFEAIKTDFKILGAIIGWVWDNVIHPVFHAISVVIGAVWTVLKPIFRAIGDAFRAIGEGIGWAWDHVISPIFEGIKTGIGKVRDFVKPIIKIISDLFRGIGEGLAWAWDHTIGWVFSAIKALLQQIQDGLAELGLYNPVHQGGTTTWNNTAADPSHVAHPGAGQSRGQHARGGRLGPGWNLVGERGIEAIFNSGSRQDVMPAESAATRAALARKAESGPMRLHPEDLAALAHLVWSRPAVFRVGSRELARAANDGNLQLARR